eukprot:CAMPEP_0198591306 /NCGR_PEP_ID=MMETSP1462-20131121/136719_1 /TAXON_ID=1333877 /ORGANISM="Brandtodinium nutriculum, Strain RCC3387" /LENGTH=170 /DNA_ID=CAMNT_0044322863 /DNA_START=9 /DNA_END=518 /DNA_ORIENTATION=-
MRSWLGTAPRPFDPDVRVMLVLVGKPRPASAQQEHCASISAGLVGQSVGAVEVRDARHAAQYVVQCAASIAESRKRRVPSRFKVAGVRCQTLPKDPQDKLRLTWISQLMQVAGVSEEVAKVVAERYPTPIAMIQAVTSAAARGQKSGEADSFVADLEVPIRGKKGSRRVG